MRQPIHTVYGGAHLFRKDVCGKLGAIAERAMTEYAPDAATAARVMGFSEGLAEKVYPRVVEKLRREPVENFHIDFEDGFGVRPMRKRMRRRSRRLGRWRKVWRRGACRRSWGFG